VLTPEEILAELESAEARDVAKAFLSDEEYKQAQPPVREAVDRFRQWMQNNLRLGRQRPVSRRLARVR